MNDLVAWIATFRDQHARAQRGQLSPEEARSYERSREQFTRALLTAQGLAIPPGASPRRSIRIARACQVDLELPRGRRRCLTLDLGAGGFSTLLPEAPPAGERIGFSLRLPGAAEPLVGRCEVVEAKRQTGNYRCSMAFLDLDERTQTRLEDRLLELALEQLPLK
jgi:hypothetical protein